ncbi:heme oxygenase (biliverdin-producing) [Actinomycetospora termitidis]|uniref:Biliverdin-producing heme oxygenase n=1 Tax=Actinomycetospora termitidis TaxID=3053470 RepID=A0ABT7M7Y4_9PSEU|nr:biliverdin-producing heme oxygenase [Actinomycetospora sp. Odt1-22]MDL5156786.1 biliverdin-producing heme oxygenase [Actinomycetospora sp. Odt1-22]
MSETAIPFHQTVRRSTLAVHDRANHSPFMGALFDGRLQVADYARLVEQYWFVYNALEATGDALADDPVAGPFVTEELRRVPHLAQDIRFYGLTELEALPATQRYVDAIEATAEWPGGFVAHHYTRYLGDLAGGQAIRGLLPRVYGVTGGGVAFYDFRELGSTPRFRDRYRALLDDAPWDADERARIVAEVERAFELNIAMLTELWDATEQPAA